MEVKHLEKSERQEYYFLIQIDENLIHLKVTPTSKRSGKLFAADAS